MRALRFLALAFFVAHARGADWREKLTPPMPPDFPALRSFTAHYSIGWSGITAGEANIQYKHRGDILVLSASGGTIGLARALWRMDAKHTATAHESTLRPIELKQLEEYRNYSVHTHLQFGNNSVLRMRQRVPEDPAPLYLTVKQPNPVDLHAAILLVRNRPLEKGETISFVAYPISSAYLAKVTVIGREKISVKAGKYKAIKLDLKLWAITKDNQLAPHAKFKRATAWLSDDKDRIPLKVEAEIFIGRVWTELDKIEFGK